MRWFVLLSVFLVVASSADDRVEVEDDETDSEEELVLAAPCDPIACKPPDCRCSSTDIPGGLAPRDTPQFVVLTFDDGVNVLNMQAYREILNNRRNINGCNIGATFYVSHEYTNYQLVNELYNNGFEIALHSITHRTPQNFWANATYEDLARELGDQRLQMSHLANIPYDEIKGLRLPFLQMAGNASFQVMSKFGLTYDSSWPSANYLNPGLWPYTLDYASYQDCAIPPCPSASFPGQWVLPMLTWLDIENTPCSMADGCYFPPPLSDELAWFQFIQTNFERNYFSNRAPFGIYLHEAFLAANPAVKNALIKFLNLVNNLHDVFMINNASVIDWVKNPISVNEYKQKPCRTFTRTTCTPRTCQLRAEHTETEYYMTMCNVCPRVYPWLGNPLGQ